jgi:alkylated DNA repair dioxygenase AlkB
MLHTVSETLPTCADVVDLARYPIHRLGSAEGRALTDNCRRALVQDGCCTLPGFLQPDAVTEMVQLANRLERSAWVSNNCHNVYFEPFDSCVEPRHPLAHQERSAKHGIAYDQIPDQAPSRRLYESDDLTRFIAAVLKKSVLFRSADPLDALQITHFHPGEELGWHFDRSKFSVTIMYQRAEEGGDFEYVPALRTKQDERYDDVKNVLQGDRSRITVQSGAPGTLAFFHGNCAMHRVTLVRGRLPRINSVLTYGEHQNMRLNDLTSQLFYGRTSPI